MNKFTCIFKSAYQSIYTVNCVHTTKPSEHETSGWKWSGTLKWGAKSPLCGLQECGGNAAKCLACYFQHWTKVFGQEQERSSQCVPQGDWGRAEEDMQWSAGRLVPLVFSRVTWCSCGFLTALSDCRCLIPRPTLGFVLVFLSMEKRETCSQILEWSYKLLPLIGHQCDQSAQQMEPRNVSLALLLMMTNCKSIRSVLTCPLTYLTIFLLVGSWGSFLRRHNKWLNQWLSPNA